MTFDEDFDAGVMSTKSSNDLVAGSLFLPLGSRGSSRTTAGFYDSADDMQLDGSFRNETRRSNTPYDLGFSQNSRRTLARGCATSLRHEMTQRALTPGGAGPRSA
jgi:hypothetical protein